MHRSICKAVSLPGNIFICWAIGAHRHPPDTDQSFFFKMSVLMKPCFFAEQDHAAVSSWLD